MPRSRGRASPSWWRAASATIGSHTHTHALLDRADGPTAADELDRSIELLGERLGVACDHFAYPKALLGSREAEAEVRSGSSRRGGRQPRQPGGAPTSTGSPARRSR